MDRRSLLAVAAGLITWPLLLLAAGLAQGDGPLIGFFASGTVLVAWASVVAGLALLLWSIMRDRKAAAPA